MRIAHASSLAALFAAAQLNQIYNRNATAKIELSGRRDKLALNSPAGNLPDGVFSALRE
jgi:hypothetical protein